MPITGIWLFADKDIMMKVNNYNSAQKFAKEYPKVPRLAARAKNSKQYSVLLMGAIVSLSSKSV
jgi:hypothetical protein